MGSLCLSGPFHYRRQAAKFIRQDWMGTSRGRAMMILIDGHVHLYRCFDPAAFLDAAAANLGRIAARRGGRGEYAAVLMLADWPNQDSLRALTGGAAGWSCEAIEGGAAESGPHPARPGRRGRRPPRPESRGAPGGPVRESGVPPWFRR